jgi:hypothetical protein
MNMKPVKYKVIEAYVSPYPESLIFLKGEIVEIGEEYKDNPDWVNWIWCESVNGIKAWVPKQYLDIDRNQGIFNQYYNAKELSVAVGEELIIDKIVNGFGMAQKSNGDKGWVPIQNLTPR